MLFRNWNRWKEWRQQRQLQQPRQAASDDMHSQVAAEEEEMGDVPDGELCDLSDEEKAICIHSMWAYGVLPTLRHLS